MSLSPLTHQLHQATLDLQALQSLRTQLHSIIKPLSQKTKQLCILSHTLQKKQEFTDYQVKLHISFQSHQTSLDLTPQDNELKKIRWEISATTKRLRLLALENITGVGGEAHFNNLLIWVYRNICQIQGYEFKEEYLWNKIKEDEDKFEYSLAYFSLQNTESYKVLTKILEHFKANNQKFLSSSNNFNYVDVQTSSHIEEANKQIKCLEKLLEKYCEEFERRERREKKRKERGDMVVRKNEKIVVMEHKKKGSADLYEEVCVRRAELEGVVKDLRDRKTELEALIQIVVEKKEDLERKVGGSRRVDVASESQNENRSINSNNRNRQNQQEQQEAKEKIQEALILERLQKQKQQQRRQLQQQHQLQLQLQQAEQQKQTQIQLHASRQFSFQNPLTLKHIQSTPQPSHQPHTPLRKSSFHSQRNQTDKQSMRTNDQTKQIATVKREISHKRQGSDSTTVRKEGKSLITDPRIQAASSRKETLEEYFKGGKEGEGRNKVKYSVQIGGKEGNGVGKQEGGECLLF